MRNIIIVQSVPDALEEVKKSIEIYLPKIENVIYQHNFEKTLAEIPNTGELIVIASDAYHDDDNKKFTAAEKDGSRLAEEIKKINPAAKVYIFSTYNPRLDFVDGHFLKSNHGDDVFVEILQIFRHLGLDS
ncbi:MAG: hypothetical protein WCK37_04125 [Candidatus Falkowbacteria bacterium]